MPIKPENKTRYPVNWPAIRTGIRALFYMSGRVMLDMFGGLLFIAGFLTLAFLLPLMVLS